MNHKDFKKRLERLEVNVTMATVRNWAKKSLIPAYTPKSRHKGRRRKKVQPSDLRGRTVRELAEQLAKHTLESNSASISRFGFYDEPYKILPISSYLQRNSAMNADSDRRQTERRPPGRRTDWSEDALVETVAIWAMKHCNGNICPKEGGIPPKAVTPEIIGTVQLIARDVYLHPHPFYRIKERMLDGLWPDEPFTYKDVEMKLASDEKLNRLTYAYISAVEKAQRKISVRELRRVVLKEDIFERDYLDPSLSNAVFEIQRGRKPTPSLEKLIESRAKNPVVRCDIDIDLEATNAECDEIVLLVREPGSEEWVDGRKLVIKSG